jgi:fatty-acyl-CoA synthase
VPERDERPTYVLRTLERFAEYGDREAIVGVGWEARLTYAQTRALVLDLAAVLRDAGYRVGMTVTVAVAHPPEAFPLQLALHLLGCRTVWIAHSTTRAEADHILAQLPPDRFIYDPRTHAEPGARRAAELGVPVHCLGPGGVGPDLLAPPPEGTEPFDLDTAVGEPRAVFQTSGTTGKPKLLIHGPGLYEQMFRIADDWVAAGEPPLRHLALTPMWHASGQAAAMLNLISGGVFFVLYRFRPSEFLALIEEHRANSAIISPLMLYQLLDEPATQTTDLSSMTLLTLGGAAVSAARLREAVERLGPIVRIAYGLSELPYISVYPGIAPDPAHPDRIRSCGPPHGDVEIEVRDGDGAVLPPGQVGELWARSRLTFLGYHAEPELTAGALVDGWLRTSDLGYQDEEGYIHLAGRAQDMIITGVGSHHVFPRPIEDVLTSHPQVRAAAVIGVPDQERGEVPHAYVVTAPGAAVTAEELTELVAGRLSVMWVPRSFDFVDELPVTGNGKTNTRELKARWIAEHQARPVPVPAG